MGSINTNKTARQTYKETTEDIYELVSNYAQTYNSAMKLQFNSSCGFHITMNTSQLATFDDGQLPEEFINVITKRKTLQFTTLELVKLGEK